MQFLYDKFAGKENLEIKNEAFLHLKARRIKVGDRIELRNLKDGKRYIYEILEISRKSADITLVFTSSSEQSNYGFSLAWAVVDPKTIEKTIPFLNELGLGKLIFVYTNFSQQNFKINLEKLERLSALSCEQCGRDKIMEFEIFANLDEFLKIHKNVALVNFSGKDLSQYKDELLFIGPEGGFSDSEVKIVEKSFALKNKNILKSQTAVISVASKFLI